MDIAEILDRGDASALSDAMRADGALIDAPVGNADHRPHPIHAICDRVFDGRLDEVTGAQLAAVLIDAGANLNHIHTSNGDGLVASAISLSCPLIAKALLDSGAPSARTGLFGATPLYWAAIMGMPELVERLITGADLSRRDE